MKAGIVVTIRVNPKDCQSVLDVMRMAGIPTDGQSFSQLTSLALSSLLETARHNKTIPHPDPFQFINRLGQFVGQSRTSKKLQTAKMITGMANDFKAPVLSSPQNTAGYHQAQQQEDDMPPPVVEVLTDQQRADRQRLSDLYAMGEDALTASEQVEYKELLVRVYGELV